MVLKEARDRQVWIILYSSSFFILFRLHQCDIDVPCVPCQLRSALVHLLEIFLDRMVCPCFSNNILLQTSHINCTDHDGDDLLTEKYRVYDF